MRDPLALVCSPAHTQHNAECAQSEASHGTLRVANELLCMDSEGCANMQAGLSLRCYPSFVVFSVQL